MAQQPVPRDLIDAIKFIYEVAGLRVTRQPQSEAESIDYGAARLGLGARAFVFRIAKTTPTKVGQFVTLWKREALGGPIAPLDAADDIDLVVVAVAGDDQRGQFLFPAGLLVSRSVMSLDNMGGKRALRVYPPWTTPTAPDALRSQRWQLHHYLPIARDGTADPAEVRRLLKF